MYSRLAVAAGGCSSCQVRKQGSRELDFPFLPLPQTFSFSVGGSKCSFTLFSFCCYVLFSKLFWGIKWSSCSAETKCKHPIYFMWPGTILIVFPNVSGRSAPLQNLQQLHCLIPLMWYMTSLETDFPPSYQDCYTYRLFLFKEKSWVV